jgi:class 3 adenylate cyclase
MSCQRAVQCAIDIQSKLNNKEICVGKTLSVKIGVGVGEVRILFVGGQFNRCEYLIVGESMRQACEAETHATEGGQIICSEDVYKYIEKLYQMEVAKEGEYGPSESGMKFYQVLKLVGDRVATKSDTYLMRSMFSIEKLKEKFKILKQFVPAAISIYLEIENELWCKEIRMLTIMFLNLKVDLSQMKNEQGLNRIQDIVRAVQRSVYRTKGSLNKFLMDDKGSVMLIVWGLPPFSNSDDPVRSVETALSLVEELKKYNCGAYMGITTGSCFTGVCGTLGNRREYSLLGEIVNLSARHMQQAIYHAKKVQEEKKIKQDYVLLVCEKTNDVS